MIVCELRCCALWNVLLQESLFPLCLIHHRVVCKFLQKRDSMPASFKSIFEDKRVKLKEKIKVTDDLLRELQTRHILTQQNIDHITVCFYHAILCRTADYAVARCLSVFVCHTPVLHVCRNSYKYSQSFFHHLVAPPF